MLTAVRERPFEKGLTVESACLLIVRRSWSLTPRMSAPCVPLGRGPRACALRARRPEFPDCRLRRRAFRPVKSTRALSLERRPETRTAAPAV
eukprot:637826-Pyramimonas_sp.AAC.1